MAITRKRAEQHAIQDTILVTLEQWRHTRSISAETCQQWQALPDFPLPVAFGHGCGWDGLLYRLAELDSWYQDPPAVAAHVLVTLEQWAPTVTDRAVTGLQFTDLPGFPLPVARGLGHGRSQYLYRLVELDTWYRQRMAQRLLTLPGGGTRTGPFSLPESDPSEMVTLAELERRLDLVGEPLRHFRPLLDEAVQPTTDKGPRRYPIGAALARLNALCAAYGPASDGPADEDVASTAARRSR